MLNKLKKAASLFAAILILCTLNITAYCHEIPDMTQKGAVSITMQLNGSPVSGAGITLYYVGEINEDNGNYSFVWTEAFKDCGLELDDIQSEQLAVDLEKYIRKSKSEGIEKTVDSNGRAVFDNLELGLYLAVQSKTPKDYVKANSFLISVPLYENEKYVYSVDASPKLELKTETTAVSEKVPGGSSKPAQSVLPKTGMLKWPVPIMSVSGLALVIIGLATKHSRRKICNEK